MRKTVPRARKDGIFFHFLGFSKHRQRPSRIVSITSCSTKMESRGSLFFSEMIFVSLVQMLPIRSTNVSLFNVLSLSLSLCVTKNTGAYDACRAERRKRGFDFLAASGWRNRKSRAERPNVCHLRGPGFFLTRSIIYSRMPSHPVSDIQRLMLRTLRT